MAIGKKFALSILLSAIDKATPNIGKVGKSLDKLGKRATKIGKGMTTSLTLPIVGVGVASVAAFAKFEAGMSNVSTLIDTSSEDIDEMGKAVLAIGRRAPVAVSGLTDALFDVRSAGVGAADQMTVLEQSARLGVAGLGSTKQAVDLVTSSMNAFKLEGEDAERVYDLIFKTTKFGKTTIEGLAQGFGSVAGTVANSGTELDEYLASVSALTTTGLPAAQAHTQLRAVIAGLTRETKQSSKVFKTLGAENFKDLIAKSGGLVPALQRVKKELRGDDAQMLKLLGSTEALGAVIGLTGAQNETYAATLENMRKGANAVDVAFDKQNKTAQAQIQRTKNALINMGVSIGQILAPVLEKLATKIQSVVDWFMSLDKGTKEFIIDVAKIVAVVGPAVLLLGKLSLAVRAIGAGFAANPIAAALIAITVAATAASAIIASDDFQVGLMQIKESLGLIPEGSTESFLKKRQAGVKPTDMVRLPDGTRVESRVAEELGFRFGAADRAPAEAEIARASAEDKTDRAAVGRLLAGESPTPNPQSIFIEFRNPPPGMQVDVGEAEFVETFVGNQLVGAE